MTNYIRGDLLLYTNKGLKRLDKISKYDIINGNNIDEITKHNLKGYSYLFKIKTLHNIDNYYLSGNNKIYCIQNIPYDLKMKDCPNFIEDNKRICTPSFINVNELTDFDYIGYPIINANDNANANANDNDNNNDNANANDNDNNNDNANDNANDNDNDNANDDKYRFLGLILLDQFIFSLNNNINTNTIGFLNKYLHNNNIPFEIFNNNITTSIKIDISDKTILLKQDELLNLSSENIKKIIKGFIEINSVINTNDKTVFYFLKNLFMKVGILLNANYINNNYVIKIPQSLEETEKNYFIYDNYIWSKIKKIGKTDKYFGHLYSIKMTNNSKYLTEVGVIS